MLNPTDDALLNDLLDERLAPADEAAVAARLEREPALREAWDELVRARELVREAPEPLPPADFVARVRARLDAEARAGSEAEPAEPSAPGPWQPEPGPEPVPVPRAWRRLMVVAYAAAAMLVLGIGLLALRERERGGPADGGTRETSLARADRATEARETGLAEGAREEPGSGTAAGRLEAVRRREERERLDAGNAVPPPAEALGSGAPSDAGGSSGPGARGGRMKAARDAEAAETLPGSPGLLGPGGAVPPGLRAPSDLPQGTAAPASKPAELGAPLPLPSGPRATPPVPPAPASALGPAPAPAKDAAPVAGEVLVLEAVSLDVGRSLLRSVTAGPGARPAGDGADAKAPASTPVSLRRLDVRRDAALIGALQRLEMAAAGRAAAAPPAAPATPPPPAAPAAAPAPSSAPLEAKAPARPATGSVLGLELLDLGPAEYARLEALLGPRSGSGGEAGASSADGRKKDTAPEADKDAAAPVGGTSSRRVRVLVVAPPR